ncbi:MAG: VanZ family protein [Gammaproteobacteria bacterium]|nr:VanZ family protein [Gammaproteobacteria bacterium]
MPTEKLPQVGSDKVAHFLTYAVLATSWGLAFISKSQITKLKILLFLIACGGVIEILQGLSGYRYAEWADFLANTLGVFLGALLASTIAKQWLFFIDQRLVKLLDKK